MQTPRDGWITVMTTVVLACLCRLQKGLLTIGVLGDIITYLSKDWTTRH